MSREDALRQQYTGALFDAEETAERVEPTADEAKNGWTAETLTAYLTEQRAAQATRIDPTGVGRLSPPMRQNSKYNAKRWRG